MEKNRNGYKELDNYLSPKIAVIYLTSLDIISTSYPGIDDERDPDLGEWDTNI